MHVTWLHLVLGKRGKALSRESTRYTTSNKTYIPQLPSDAHAATVDDNEANLD
jgi:hypothetical protein